ncbi:putative BUD13-like protein [Hypsibius exemplaris]|uniref:BUD13 homolog n=1 Tax=Hypsibius exemplaris TaxID=2072580 RepID=A0A1W0X6T9_HYPEX|nr:putative BUD13-like protein [Hypsibius exemplaris]
MTAPPSKLDYLKRYMSDAKGPVEKRKKRKKVPFNPKASSGIIVVDNEIEVHKLKKTTAYEDDPYHDNGPTVAEIFDESIPRGMQDSKKWKSIVHRDGEDGASGGGGSGSRGTVAIRQESPGSDLSPPRQMLQSTSSKSKRSKGGEKPRRRERSEDSDLSPDRGPSGASSRRSPSEVSSSQRATESRRRTSDRGRRRSSSGDLSPVRVSSSAVGQTGARSPDSDLSPDRNDGGSSIKLSTSALPTKTLSGMSAGLQSASTLREEADRRRRREEETFRKMDADISGRDAETVYRDRKTGKKRNMEDEAKVEEEKAARKKVHDDKFKKWGKGLVQGEKHAENVSDALHEMSKPLARYVDDSDRDTLLKAIDREGDPMLEYLKTKKVKSSSAPDRPRYKGPPPAPNRFAIPPGYRWDGVDRSNNFEKNRYNRISNRSAVTEEAYKWSTEDM